MFFYLPDIAQMLKALLGHYIEGGECSFERVDLLDADKFVH